MKISINLKLIVYTITVISTIIVISSRNILIVWLSIEINLFSFILLLINNSTTNEIEASIDYFLPQALGSILFLISSRIILNFHWFHEKINILMRIAIAIKLGIVPCHYWLPLTIEKIRWINCLILSTWQKIAPLFIIVYIIKPKTNIRTLIAALNALIGRIIGLRQVHIKKIIAYSSITHIGWILVGPATKTPCISIAYLILYRIISVPLFTILNKTNIDTLYQPWKKQNTPNNLKICTVILLLSLGGLPPLTGFVPKLLIINILLKYSIILTVILIFASLLNLYFYLNIRLNILITTKIKKLYENSKNIPNPTNTVLRIRSLGLILIIL